jgi:hypothetical protein
VCGGTGSVNCGYCSGGRIICGLCSGTGMVYGG